ncbi:hypothetical protein CWT12_02030 [Actinomyces sp. 432]|uniref:glycosyl hydrolase n=1 Tax=Actinomyces sp. 432 TaxID=2057798 RepID=UPI0013744129|nr:glycosyl hydrolase [Actinomyces sp. 432]QHO90364.1 hypothetical protein CWT12_02030 [Actinomyces sp. 432]
MTEAARAPFTGEDARNTVPAAGPTLSPALDALRAAIAEPPIEYRPELRWWLAEGLHTDATIRREIAAAHRLGFGGMEFLAMPEENIDETRYGWGSEEWTHDSHMIVAETTARGMSFSFTSGTNWSNANLPTITPDDPAAAQELNVAHESVRGARSGPLPRIDLDADHGAGGLPGSRVAPKRQHFVAAVAGVVVPDHVDASDDAAPGTVGPTGAASPAAQQPAPILDVDTLTDLTAHVSGHEGAEALDWTPPDSRDWRLFVFWMHGTGQTASPSASVNYTVNYLDRDGVDAVIDYWRDVVLTDGLKADIARNPRAQMYMDSLELNTWGEGGMFWGRCVAEEFRNRRGYDITPWLPLLTRSAPLMAVSTRYRFEPDAAHGVEVTKVRHDYVATLTDLYIEHMLQPFAQFLHEYGISLRAEISYGLPFELTRPGAAVDGIEAESLEFGAQIDAYRLMAGPAHLLGKQYSSETGATTRNHMLPHRFYDQIINTQLAAGITKTVLHGWSSPAGAAGTTEWPGHEGMLPMFSERFDTRQPAAEFYPLWNRAVGRMQQVLRRGRPRIDVGILRTDHFTDNSSGMMFYDGDTRIPDEVAYGTMWMRNRQNHWWRDLGMQDAGWGYEFFDGSLLLREDMTFADGVVQPDGPGYQALVVYQEALDADVAARLLDWARAGLRVLIVNGASELKRLETGEYFHYAAAAARTPGRDGRDEELATTMTALKALPSVAKIDDPAHTVEALRSLGLVGYHEFDVPNQNVLAYERIDGDLTHVYVYHFLYETGQDTEVALHLPGAGTAYWLDQWSGRFHELGDAHAEPIGPDRSDVTVVPVRLRPGEAAIITLDRSAPAATGEAGPSGTAGTRRADDAVVVELPDWEITVDSWDAGPDELIEEDRGLGYVTREVLPTTVTTRLRAGASALEPWKDLDRVGPEVSGVGEYRTTFTLAAVPAGRLVLDLGDVCGGLGSVSINGGAPIGFDTSAPRVDVTGLLHPGGNDVVVRVSSSLSNRLRARGYYETIPDISAALSGKAEATHDVPVRSYGLLGPVRLLARS